MTDSIILIILIIFLVIVSLSVVILILGIISMVHTGKNGAPYVPNDSNVIKKSLKLANLGSKDTLIDLGSGNGKVLRIAVSNFNAKKAIGYEISLIPFLLSGLYQLFSASNIRSRVQTIRKDLFKANLSKANVIYIYLLPEMLEKATPMLKKYKKKNPKARIVCPVFPIKGLRVKKKIRTYHLGFRSRVEIFLY